MKVTVIVPVYNSESTLRRCFDSIRAQELKDFECIIIDDGSKDGSPQICDDYAAQDARFRVVHKVNGGVSTARNEGLELARGEWVTFIDSDDAIKPDHLSTLTGLTNAYIDLVVTGFEEVHSEEVLHHHYDGSSYRGTDGMRQFLCQTDFLDYQVPWDKLYRRSVIEQHRLRFNKELSLSEDRLFIYEYLCHAQGVATTATETYTQYRENGDSLSSRLPSMEMQVKRCQLLMPVTKQLLERFAIKKDDAYRFLSYAYSIFKSAILSLADAPLPFSTVLSRQRELYKACFDATLYDMSCQRIHMLKEKPTDRLIFKGRFVLLYIYVKLKKLL